MIGGTQSTDLGWRNHGTAVVGEFGGDVNAFGITGHLPGRERPGDLDLRTGHGLGRGDPPGGERAARRATSS